MGSWPCLSLGLGLIWFLWTGSATVAPVLTDSQLCADTFMHSSSSLCVFFSSGLSTGFRRPVSHHSSHPVPNITPLSLRLLCPSPGPSTQHGQITCLKAVWWGHASSQNTSGCPDLLSLRALHTILSVTSLPTNQEPRLSLASWPPS